MKAGFTLIELILAFMFSSIILTVLFNSFFQINRSSLLTEDIIDMNTRMLIMQNQFEKDLSGAFVPVQGIVEKKKEEEKPKDEVAQKKEKAEVPKKEKPKPVNDIFYSANKGDSLNELTFISNNPMRVYEYAENAQVKPCVVRIVYRLVPDPKKKGSFILTRQEGTELDFAQYKKNATKPIKAYELADNIKSLSIEFTAPITKEEKKEPTKETKDKKEPVKEKKEKKKAEPVPFETKKEWRSNELREKKPETSQLPQFVTIKLILWDNQYENERTFTFNYKIAAFGQDLVKVKPEEEQKEEKSQATKKTAAQQERYRPTIAELKSSIKEFVDMMHGKNV